MEKTAQALFMLPSMAERLEFLSYKYGPASRQFEYTFQSILRNMIFSNKTTSQEGQVEVQRTNADSSFLDSLWETLTERYQYDFDHTFYIKRIFQWTGDSFPYAFQN